MVKKIKASAEVKDDSGQLASAIRESAEKIWLAGLGAFAKARKEPTKAFEILVREGLNLQSKTKAMAEERIGDVSGKVNDVKTQLSSRATESWDKLEQVFEDRVSRALERLGVPARKDVQALIQRVDDLTAAIEAMGGTVPAKASSRPARKAVAKGTPAKPAAAKPAPRKAAARKGAAVKVVAEASPQTDATEAPKPAPVRKPRARKAAEPA